MPNKCSLYIDRHPAWNNVEVLQLVLLILGQFSPILRGISHQKELDPEQEHLFSTIRYHDGTRSLSMCLSIHHSFCQPTCPSICPSVHRSFLGIACIYPMASYFHHISSVIKFDAGSCKFVTTLKRI